MSYVISSRTPPLSSVILQHLVVRIGEDNSPSIRLFEKLGFVITKRVEIFNEVEMRVDDATVDPQSWSKGKVVFYSKT